MYNEIKYDEFFIHEMKFTVEDYGNDSAALYHEDSFVAEVSLPYNQDEATAKAVNYYMHCK